MDAGVVSGTLHPAPVVEHCESDRFPANAGAGKVRATLRVTAARS
jgi:hypothetical protein